MWRPTVSSDEIWHSAICHSAKGTTWKNHKYLKKIGDAYIYAKSAFKFDKASRKYESKQRKAYYKAGSALADSVSARMGHPDYNVKSKNKKDDPDSKKYAHTQAEMATRYRDASWKNGSISRRYKRKAIDELKSIPKEVGSDITNSINKGKKMVNNWLEKRKRKKRAKKTAAAAQAKGKNRTWNETARHGKTITEKKIREKRITEKRR